MLTRQRVDITSPRFKADPFSFYEELRRDRPVWSVALPNGKPAWLISRYDDVVAALKDPRLVKNRRNVPGSKQAGLAWTPKMFEPLTRNMLDSDPPDHTRLRALVHKAFTPRVVERMHERIEAVANQLLDGMTPNQTVDLIEVCAAHTDDDHCGVDWCARRRPTSTSSVVERDCVDHAVDLVNAASDSTLACLPPIHSFAGRGPAQQAARRFLVRARCRRRIRRTVEHR
jgi:hypothetical protein